MNLYWVTTEDHHEDWFVLAKDPQNAEVFFEEYEGYDDDTAFALLVCTVNISEAGADWADHALLESLGAEIQEMDSGRVVQLLGETYAEGMLDGIIRQCDAAVLQNIVPPLTLKESTLKRITARFTKTLQ